MCKNGKQKNSPNAVAISNIVTGTACVPLSVSVCVCVCCYVSYAAAVAVAVAVAADFAICFICTFCSLCPKAFDSTQSNNNSNNNNGDAGAAEIYLSIHLCDGFLFRAISCIQARNVSYRYRYTRTSSTCCEIEMSFVALAPLWHHLIIIIISIIIIVRRVASLCDNARSGRRSDRK